MYKRQSEEPGDAGDANLPPILIALVGEAHPAGSLPLSDKSPKLRPSPFDAIVMNSITLASAMLGT